MLNIQYPIVLWLWRFYIGYWLFCISKLGLFSSPLVKGVIQGGFGCLAVVILPRHDDPLWWSGQRTKTNTVH